MPVVNLCIEKPTVFFFAMMVRYNLVQAYVSSQPMLFFAYATTIVNLALISVSDAFVSALVNASRKALNIGLSFVLFPKPILVTHMLGASLFFTGVLGNVFANKFKKSDKKNKI